MRKRLYHRFPNRAPDFEQRYRYKSDLAHFLKVMAGMHKKYGMFEIEAPGGKTVKAKREFHIGIADRGIDFMPLFPEKVEKLSMELDPQGTVDFKVEMKYLFMAEGIAGLPSKGDTFVLRADLQGDVLTLTVNLIDGSERTTPAEVANTVVEEIRRSA